MISRHFRLPALFILGLAGSACFSSCTGDRLHQVHISIPEQRMAVFRKGEPIRSYPVSTSKFGLGDRPGSNRTPIGTFKIRKKIGGGAPAGAVFKDRRWTGEVLPPDAPGRDPIISRILWLDGLEGINRNAFNRYIYIHGTPEERHIGKPVSYGCIRMRSRDIIDLYGIVGRGARVFIVRQPIPAAFSPSENPTGPPTAMTSNPGGTSGG